MHLRHGDWVIVCDAGKYIVYENEGDTDRLDLRIVSFDELVNPPARSHGTDRPGRYSSPDGQRSAVGDTDRHELEEHRFIAALAEQMDGWAAADRGRHFVLVADPRSMGTLRKTLSAQTTGRITHTVTGDHVHRPVDAIEALVSAA